uniref:Serine/threonine-protein kinase-like protein At3g51990 family n=1 Tax=Cajanus cajan TaxID=3821 RepID=A0A151TLQ4_CAJCA|nr:Serine/threonine-protein kinase-like protein At3g51990 family [Cajanus cajan]
MGYLYLSCRAESAVSTSNSVKEKEKEKNIKIQEFEYSDLEAATNGFSERKLLGKGSHGYVYKAVVRGRPVAVKRPSRPHQMTNEVDNEIDILSKIQSPRLVNLVGFTSNDSKDRLLVVEFMSNGTLYDVLHSSPRPPNWGRRIRLALQTAKAIDILHSSTPPVIHRDIKSANVLIDRSYNARLGDFGLALRGHVDDYKLSFGILLLEIISGRKAIDITYSPPSIVDWAIPLIKKGKLLGVYDPRIAPPKDPLVRKQLAVIAAKCVRSCRERRPSMSDVVIWLCGLCKLLPLHSWNGFNINNPCMMVETVGRPVEAPRTAQFGLEGGNFDFSKSAMRYSRRVYSDLGFSSNLMDLMATTEEPEFLRDADGVLHSSKSAEQVSSSRFGSGRYSIRGRNRNLYRPCGSEKDAFGLSKGQNVVVGAESEASKQDLSSMAPEVI